MRARPFSSLAIAAAIAFSAYGCGATDSPAAPQQRSIEPATPASRTLLGSPQTVTPLLRLTSLAAPITASKTIGILGGAIAIPSAGVTVVVPPFAVTSNTTISVTAMAGSNVAYEFAPHGLNFNVPLVMTQNLVGTQAQSGGLVNPLSLYVGYFPNSSSPNSVTELLSVGVNLLGQTAVTTLWHFSGYIYASGRDDE
jgi:hypothetical protein